MSNKMETALQSVREFETELHQPSPRHQPIRLSPPEKSDLIRQLRERLAHPYKINQCRASLCGPATFAYCLLLDAPDQYVQMVRELCLLGNTMLGQLPIRPSASALNNRQLNGLALVDWLTLASLRDSANRWFRYNRADNSFRGITWPGELVHWFHLAGYRHVVNRSRLFPHQSMALFTQALQSHAEGRHICLFVDGSSEQRPFPIKNIANHWVVLHSAQLTENDTDAEVAAFSWGQARFTLNNLFRAQKRFEDHFFGYIEVGDYDPSRDSSLK